MRESFLHYLWRMRRFDAQNLRSTEGHALEILHFGEYNPHAGPDFFNARLRIGHTLWAGNVEMHLLTSEWLAHGHSSDPAYDNVVLHVALEEDRPIFRPNGERIPCLELRHRIPPKILERYARLEREQAWIPCQRFFPNIPDIVRLGWLDRLLVERLEEKTAPIASSLQSTENHWEETFYRSLARSFGLKINAEPFESLARSLPLRVVAKHKSSLLQVEALLFGQAGFLSQCYQDDWPKNLAREYRHLANKFALQALASSQWKFLRLRPASFPTVRLAQLAALLHHSGNLFSQILEAKTLRELECLFDVQPSAYWENHFLFDKISVAQQKKPGQDFVHSLIINTVVPFLFFYGKTKDWSELQNRSLRLLEELPAESNSVLRGWAEIGAPYRNAYQSQALLQLKTRYCDAKRCLECAIGNSILK